mmetsp:Transcript_560/g.1496  ORF Transcript_560/g.1496 Transcript_560/m.1496 type:complete len:362 (-) Transcript_560:44-1129(-)
MLTGIDVTERRPLTSPDFSSLLSRSTPRDVVYSISISPNPPADSSSTSWTAAFPRASDSSTYGLSSFRTSGATAGAFTAEDPSSPLMAPITASAISYATSSWASLVLAPRWGVQMTSGRPTNGWSAAGGSGSNTSRAAPATMPASSARASAASSITPPRATLMMRAPFLIFPNVSSPNSPLVSGVSGMCREKKSPAARASSKDTSLTPRALARSSDAYGSWAITVIPNPLARRATSPPTFPNPITAKVLPTIETPTYLERSHLPAFIDTSACATFLASAHSIAIPCSAAATVLAVGAFTTRHPVSLAAVRSTLSIPTPARPTTLRRPAEASNTSRSTLVAERMTMASTVLIFSNRAARSRS